MKTLLTTLLLSMLVAVGACGQARTDSAVDPAADPPAAASDDESPPGVGPDESDEEPWCPERLVAGDDDEALAFDHLPVLGAVPRAEAAWTCSYHPMIDAEQDGASLHLAAAPAVVGPSKLRKLNELLGRLAPADPDRICTAELGMTHHLVLRTAAGSSGLEIATYGCRDAHFVPSRTARLVDPGPPPFDHLSSEAMTTPAELIDLLRLRH